MSIDPGPPSPAIPRGVVRATTALYLLAMVAGAVLALKVALGDTPWVGVNRLKLVAGVAATLGAGAVLRWVPAGVRVNLALAGVVVWVTAMGLDLVLLLRPTPNPVEDARRAHPGYDHRNPREVARARSLEIGPSVPAVYPIYAMREPDKEGLLPLSGISRIDTVLCNESGEYAVYDSDEYGFRNPEGLPREVDVAILGDSYIHGHCVGPGRDLASLLRRRELVTVSLGMSASGPLIELATLIEYALPRRPRVVVWAFYEGNDEGDLRIELEDARLRRYLENPGHALGLMERQAEIDAYWRRYLDHLPEWKLDHTAVFWRSVREVLTLYHVRSLLRVQRGAPRDVTEELKQVLGRAVDLTRDAGATLVFVYIPTWERLNPRDEGESDGGRKQRILSVAESLGVEIVDLAARLNGRADRNTYFPFGLSGHFNEDGYELMADEIMNTAALRALTP